MIFIWKSSVALSVHFYSYLYSYQLLIVRLKEYCNRPNEPFHNKVIGEIARVLKGKHCVVVSLFSETCSS